MNASMTNLTGMGGELAMPQVQVNVAAMADIVEELVAGGRVRLQDGRWLRERATGAGLGHQERAALDALRLRLRAQGTALLDTAVKAAGIW